MSAEPDGRLHAFKYWMLGSGLPFAEPCTTGEMDAACLESHLLVAGRAITAWNIVGLMSAPGPCRCASCIYKLAVVEAWPRQRAWVKHCKLMHGSLPHIFGGGTD